MLIIPSELESPVLITSTGKARETLCLVGGPLQKRVAQCKEIQKEEVTAFPQLCTNSFESKETVLLSHLLPGGLKIRLVGESNLIDSNVDILQCQLQLQRLTAEGSGSMEEPPVSLRNLQWRTGQLRPDSLYLYATSTNGILTTKGSPSSVTAQVQPDSLRGDYERKDYEVFSSFRENSSLSHSAQSLLQDEHMNQGQLMTSLHSPGLDVWFRDGLGPLHLAFLCEYDVLPGIGHTCGHNLIAEVEGALEGLPGPPPPVKIIVLGTPAEEDGGGKIDLIEAGAFKNLDIVFMAHPSQENAAYPDIAEHDVTVKYYGKASHAAAYPWEGVNALDAAILAYNNLSTLRQQMKPTWRVHGIIKNGGVKPNFIPSYSELIYYFHAPSMKELQVLTKKAEDCFRAAALATGCTVEIKGGAHDYYNVLPNKRLWKAYVENGEKLGIEFISEDTISSGPSGSTDFGNVTFVVLGIHPYFYIGSKALNHTEQYAEAAGSQEAQFYTLPTAKALAMTALDVIFKPELLEKIREDFKLKLQEEQFLNTVE
ncbi:LOW QUALITY PROTEIN: xaa-Arg dipeptidase-like [Nycticebus coucang]|uniref:LOW QUALITY PROTEIN: xaa-Arg dipeptidase-like n=1 Tax=Nycticebus coucang TaxID=9470 RepID=UPI00234CEEB2|nr:LOW QUALITY PROTEIN: xaa-Arg dipeptidase-like [Nycticebus coucang]